MSPGEKQSRGKLPPGPIGGPSLRRNVPKSQLRAFYERALADLGRSKDEFLGFFEDALSAKLFGKRTIQDVTDETVHQAKVYHAWTIGQALGRFAHYSGAKMTYCSGPFALAVCGCDEHLLGTLGELIVSEPDDGVYGHLVTAAPYINYVQAILNSRAWIGEMADEVARLEPYQDRFESLPEDEVEPAVASLDESTIREWLGMCRQNLSAGRNRSSWAGASSNSGQVAAKMLPFALNDMRMATPEILDQFDNQWQRWSNKDGLTSLAKPIADSLVALETVAGRRGNVKAQVWNDVLKYRYYKKTERENTLAFQIRKKLGSETFD